MPSTSPLSGETWELRDQYNRVTRGIVAEIGTHSVTLVALTGARIRVPTSRFPQQWTFVASPPKTHIKCSRCRDPGILQFHRGVSPDYTCPRHLPVGIIASLHTPGNKVAEADRTETPRDIIQCPQCGDTDPVEDVRIGRLERGEFGWWTCTKCSSRWGLVSRPPRDVDNKGRWYEDTIRELRDTMLLSQVNPSSIELSTDAWESLLGAARRGEAPDLILPKDDPETGAQVGELFEVPLYLVPYLTEGSVLLKAGNAPAGGILKPIQRIGGVGGRSGAVGEGNGTPATSTIMGALSEIYANDPVARTEATRIARALRETTAEKERPAPKVPDLPVEGTRYFQRKTGREVEVIRIEVQDGQYAIGLQGVTNGPGVGNAPYILWLNDFHAEYLPAGSPSTVPPPEPIPHPRVVVNEKEEWLDHGSKEYVLVSHVDLRKMVVRVVGCSTGRFRHVTLDDFADPSKFTKLVRKSAIERLIADDE